MLQGTSYTPSNRDIVTGLYFTRKLALLMNNYDAASEHSEEYGLESNEVMERSASKVASRNVDFMKDWATAYGYKPEITLIHIESIYKEDMPDVMIHEMEAF